MPVPAYMTIEGETQGSMTDGGCSEDSIGTLSREDREDYIQLQEFRHNIMAVGVRD
jgi:type VI secretion system secreted protein Hcp